MPHASSSGTQNIASAKKSGPKSEPMTTRRAEGATSEVRQKVHRFSKAFSIDFTIGQA